jgi:hypothetical protein
MKTFDREAKLTGLFLNLAISKQNERNFAKLHVIAKQNDLDIC